MFYYIFNVLFTFGMTALVVILNSWYVAWYHYLIIVALLFAFNIAAIIIDYAFFFGTGLLIPVDQKEEFKLTKDNRYARWLYENTVDGFLMTVRCKIHSTNFDKIPSEGGFLIVSNHRALFDPMCLSKNLHGRDLRFIIKKQLMSVPAVKNVTYNCGFLKVDRDNLRQSMRMVARATTMIKDEHKILAVYPEGTRNKTDAEILPFHPGTIKIALKAECPIVVATSINSELIKKHVPFKRTHVYINVSRVLQYDEYKDMSTTELTTLIENIVKEDFLRLKNEHSK